MNALASKNQQTIRREAEDWFAAANAGSLDPSEQRDLDAWLSADTRHRDAYAALEVTLGAIRQSTDLAFMAKAEAASLERARGKREWLTAAVSHWRPISAVAASLALILVGSILLRSETPVAPQGDVMATAVAEIRAETLADGSTVTLGAKSSIEVGFNEQERRVVLSAGEALFDVEKDPTRPFVVIAGGTVVRVVGTKFDVSKGPDHVRVSVLEGVVDVFDGAAVIERTPRLETRKHTLTAGERALANLDGAVASVEAVSELEAASWTTGRLFYDDVSLREVIADVNRYYDGRIEFETRALGDLRVSAAFSVDEIDAMINALTRGMPVDADRSAPGRIVIRAKRDG